MIATAVLLIFLVLPASAQQWSVDSSTGYFRVIILKEGLLSSLGHDHVLDARDARGTVAIAGSTGSVHLEINAAGVEIDQPSSDAEEGFDKSPSESDRAKIRANMRGKKGLDVLSFPFIKFDSTSVEKVESVKDHWMVSGTFSLHGSTGTLDFPVVLAERPGGCWVSGYVRIHPSEYGIKPFSVMGGMIRVQDEALVKFNLALKASVPAP
jgi:polyisoprenoid-binding protein YceI